MLSSLLSLTVGALSYKVGVKSGRTGVLPDSRDRGIRLQPGEYWIVKESGRTGEGDREKEKDRKKEREKDRKKERERERKGKRQTEREREREREREGGREGERERAVACMLPPYSMPPTPKKETC